MACFMPNEQHGEIHGRRATEGGQQKQGLFGNASPPFTRNGFIVHGYRRRQRVYGEQYYSERMNG